LTTAGGIGHKDRALSYLPNIFSLDFRSFNFELVDKSGVDQVRDKQCQAERPHKRDGVEEVGIS